MRCQTGDFAHGAAGELDADGVRASVHDVDDEVAVQVDAG